MRFQTSTPPGPNVVPFGQNFSANAAVPVSGIITNGPTQLTGIIVIRNDLIHAMEAAAVCCFPSGAGSFIYASAGANIMTQPGGGAQAYQSIIPIDIPPGAQFEVTALMAAASVNSTLSIYGINGPIPNISVRADGRTYPVGSQLLEGALPLTVSPPFGSARAFIKSIDILGQGAAGGGGICSVTVTVNGTMCNLSPVGFAASGWFGVHADYPEGLLCDYNTAITAASFGTAPGFVQYAVIYDWSL